MAATAPGYTSQKEDVLGRLRRIEGQVRGLQGMVEGDRYCIDILTQVASVSKALQAVALNLLDGHMRHCVVEAAQEGDDGEKIDEAMAAVARLLRT